MTCEWCETNAGRTSSKDCCVLRRLAQMPANRLREYAKRLSKAEQDELRPRLIDERKRLREIENGHNKLHKGRTSTGRT
jgi:hypothetical protein